MDEQKTDSTVTRLPACPCGGPAQIVSGGPGNQYIRCETCGISTDDGSHERVIGLWGKVTAANARLTAEVERLRSPRWAGVIPLLENIMEEEGASITLTGPNPDFNDLPNECVIVQSGPDWEEAEFRADTLAECLTAALARQGDAA